MWQIYQLLKLSYFKEISKGLDNSAMSGENKKICNAIVLGKPIDHKNSLKQLNYVTSSNNGYIANIVKTGE